MTDPTHPFRKPGKQEEAPTVPTAPVHAFHGMEYIDGSFIMERHIPAGHTAVFTSKDCAEDQRRVWLEGIIFVPAYLIYVGDPDLWLEEAHVLDCQCFGSGPLPLDSFRPCAHHTINWPVFGAHHPLELTVTNRSAERDANFAVRFGGKYEHRR